MDINEYLKKHKRIEMLAGKYETRRITPQVECVDGFRMSVQVSENHYCSPRVNDAFYYAEVEVGYPSEKEELLMPYCESPEKPTDTVYGYVPVEVVDSVIEKHGGFKPEAQPEE